MFRPSPPCILRRLSATPFSQSFRSTHPFSRPNSDAGCIDSMVLVMEWKADRSVLPEYRVPTNHAVTPLARGKEIYDSLPHPPHYTHKGIVRTQLVSNDKEKKFWLADKVVKTIPPFHDVGFKVGQKYTKRSTVTINMRFQSQTGFCAHLGPHDACQHS